MTCTTEPIAELPDKLAVCTPFDELAVDCTDKEVTLCAAGFKINPSDKTKCICADDSSYRDGRRKFSCQKPKSVLLTRGRSTCSLHSVLRRRSTSHGMQIGNGGYSLHERAQALGCPLCVLS